MGTEIVMYLDWKEVKIMQKINRKEIKGFQYADGVHWYWGDKEVAVINELRREIEWCDRTFNFPTEVVNAIRDKIPTPDGQWIMQNKYITCIVAIYDTKRKE